MVHARSFMYVHLSIDIQSVKVILNLKKKLNLNIFEKVHFEGPHFEHSQILNTKGSRIASILLCLKYDLKPELGSGLLVSLFYVQVL